VIFDVDGRLVDSNDAHARAWVDAFAEHGITVAYESVRRAIKERVFFHLTA
jgi:beta-phosphoglucomutase-like phosphatase (HAD superfamily)